LYSQGLDANAPTIMEHVRSFGRYSSARVWTVNTAMGFPRALRTHAFEEIILHYSLFGAYPFQLHAEFADFVRRAGARRIVAFFQDEHQHCPERRRLIDGLGIDTIYSVLDPRYFDEVYLQRTTARRVHHTLTGYVDDALVERARDWTVPLAERRVEVGYRGRQLPVWNGAGAQEKVSIATEFVERTRNRGLRLDVSVREEDRIYGADWYRFLASCRAVLGVEAGVSVFDLDGTVHEEVATLLAREPNLGIDAISRRVLARHENRIHYRTISPRVFEAAALRVAQILFEGEYQGILQPGVHYIPLRKDFSNLDEVLATLADDTAIERMTGRAYDDLVASGRYSYQRFIRDFDAARPWTAERRIHPADPWLWARLRVHELSRRVPSTLSHAWLGVVKREWPGKPAAKWIYRKWRGRAGRRAPSRLDAHQ
jgi:hypothetical protein